MKKFWKNYLDIFLIGLECFMLVATTLGVGIASILLSIYLHNSLWLLLLLSWLFIIPFWVCVALTQKGDI